MFSRGDSKVFFTSFVAENLDISANASFSGFSSDLDKNDTSKTEASLPLDKQQLVELENQLVLKIMKHFKENFNYTPTSPEDEFYSPIGEKWTFRFHKHQPPFELRRSFRCELSTAFHYFHHFSCTFMFFLGHLLTPAVFLGSPPDTSYSSDPDVQAGEDDAVSGLLFIIYEF